MDTVKRLFQQGALVTMGASLLFGLNWLFDYIAYPLTMYQMGSLTGAVIMTIASIPFNYLLIKGYDLIGRDMLGIETLKKFEAEQTNATGLKLYLKLMMTRSRLGTFVFISLYDPIPATLYMRDMERVFKGLRGSDWKWFGISTVIANIFWIIAIATGIEVFDYLNGYIVEIFNFLKHNFVD